MPPRVSKGPNARLITPKWWQRGRKLLRDGPRGSYGYSFFSLHRGALKNPGSHPPAGCVRLAVLGRDIAYMRAASSLTVPRGEKGEWRGVRVCSGAHDPGCKQRSGACELEASVASPHRERALPTVRTARVGGWPL